MQLKPTEILGKAGRHRLQGAALATAVIAGSAGTAVMFAHAASESDEYSSEGSELTSYPDPKTSGDRGEGQVYQQERKVSPESRQSVQRAPEPRTAGDRGKGQVQRGQEAYMGRYARRQAAQEDIVRGTAGDRGIGRAYTQRAEETDLDAGAVQDALDDVQAMIDEMQAGLDDSQAALDEERFNPTPGTAGDRGIGRVYRPGRRDVVDPYYTGETYTAPPPRTSGDRGRGRIQRGERVYSERLAHEREPGGGAVSYGRGEDRPPEVLPRYELGDVGGVAYDAQGRPIQRGPRTSGDRGVGRIQRGMEEPVRSARERLRYYPAPRTSGDRGVGQVWREEMLAREQSRLDREQRLLDRQQRRLDRLQRELDREVEQVARRTAGDRGVGVARVEQSPTIQDTLDQLFSQLDENGDQTLTMEEAGRLTIVQRNYADLDNNEDGEVSHSEFTDIVEESEAL